MNKIVQKQFIAFHDNIRVNLEDNKALIEKRNMLIDELNAFFKKLFEDKKTNVLIKFTSFQQGSYAMGTGNKPANEEDDYDIDCGLLFEISTASFAPLTIKQWVFEAFDSKQFRTVEWKKACIRVQYVEKGLPKFHLDFACYAVSNSDGKIYLAKGTPTSAAENKKWEQTEPKVLRDLINNKFKDVAECDQFKRVIRDFKRWKDEQFFSVYGRPTGIALTALAYNGFQPFTRNLFTGVEEVDDLKAVKELATYMLRQFRGDGRIRVQLPVPPYYDLFEKMTDQQCEEFKAKLEALKTALGDAENETDPHEACKILKRKFGEDFPVPAKEETGQNRRKAVAGTSESA
jgi:hypothetical protein